MIQHRLGTDVPGDQLDGDGLLKSGEPPSKIDDAHAATTDQPLQAKGSDFTTDPRIVYLGIVSLGVTHLWSVCCHVCRRAIRRYRVSGHQCDHGRVRRQQLKQLGEHIAVAAAPLPSHCCALFLWILRNTME